MKKVLCAALAGAAFIATPASAEVNWNPTTGGFVGKGDVQNAFGWNNATLQSEWGAGEISFRYDTSTDYSITCEWDTENKKQTIHHSVTNVRSYGLSASLAAEGRQRNQITGFFVGGAGSGSGGDAPEVGDACPMAHATAVMTDVQPLGSSGGGLYVSWNGQDVLLQAAQ